MSITPSQIIQYNYCPRFIYFEYVLCIPQYEDRHFKVNKGRNIHEIKQLQNKSYLRKRLGVVEKFSEQYLTNDILRGQVDEVFKLNDGTAAPMDYKFAKWNDVVYKTYKTQLYCYAVLIEHNFKMPVKRGFLVYTRSKNKLVELEIKEKEKSETSRLANEILDIIKNNRFPVATKIKSRCLNCTYRNICIQ